MIDTNDLPQETKDKLSEIYNEIVQQTNMIYDKQDPIFGLLIMIKYLNDYQKNEMQILLNGYKNQLSLEAQKLHQSFHEIQLRLSSDVLENSLKNTLALNQSVGGAISEFKTIIANARSFVNRKYWQTLGISLCTISINIAILVYLLIKF